MVNQTPQFGNPVAPAAIRRSKYLEDAITGIQKGRDKSVYNTAFGTNASILGDAILAFSRNDANSKADAAVQADQQRLTDAIMGTPQKTANAALETDAPFDLTPGGIDQRGQATDDARLQAIAEIGGPAALLQYQQAEEAKKYARGRDQRADFVDDRGFGFQQGRAERQDFVDDRGFGFQQGRAERQDYVDDRSHETGLDQFGQTMDLNRDQFDFTRDRAGVQDQQWGAEFGENQRQFNERMAAERAAAAEAARLKQAELEAKSAGGAVFEGPQLATIYNKSMDALAEARAAQENYDTISTAAQQFLDRVGTDDMLQGSSWFNDAMQLGSMKTSDLKAITDSIAPLMRKPGSGASSDTDVQMFRNSVVNVNNTPGANQRFAQGAQAMAKRNQAYIDFMTQAITPQDPQSRQKADQLWNIYKDDQTLFNDDGTLNDTALPFDAWLSENMGFVTATPNGMPTGIQRPPVGAPIMGIGQSLIGGADDDTDALVQKWLK